MSRVIILDDDITRVNWFRRNFKDVPYTWCSNVYSFLGALEKYQETVQVLIMDHDLGIDQTGADAARSLAYKVHEGDLTLAVTVLVWSMNPAGALTMQSWLNNVKITSTATPFGSYNLKETLNGYLNGYKKD